MEVNEPIARAALEKDGDSECWYCETPPPARGLVNQTASSPPASNADTEINSPENVTANDSSELAKAMGLDAAPKWSIKNPLNPTNETAVVPAAHHCIPGEASFNKSNIAQVLKSNPPIGYSINHEKNGVWLPGNYAVREDNADFGYKTWSKHPKKRFQLKYVDFAMEKAANRMFHDAHTKYNAKVLNTLENMAAKLLGTTPSNGRCPICSRSLKERKNNAPYGLVARLDFVSSEHRNMLLTPKRETVQAGYFTSSKGRDVFLNKAAEPR